MIYAPLALMFVWIFFRFAVLSLDATNGLNDPDGRITRRLYTGLWAAFNLTTCALGIALLRSGWTHLPQPIPPLLTLFTAAVWWGLFFISSGMLIKALIRRGGFDDPEGRLSKPLSPNSSTDE